VGELAVRAVGLAHSSNSARSRRLLVQQPVDGAAAGRGVGELAGGAAAQPPPGAPLAQLEHPAGGPDRPALSGRLVQQPQQAGLVA
jgi:hypothetical protein